MINFTVGSEIFREKFFEKELLYIQAGIDHNLYSWKKFSDEFFSVEPALGTVRFYRDGRIDRSSYQYASQQHEEIAHKFDVASVNGILENGGSMVINRFEKSSSLIARLCQEVKALCGHATVGNAYITKGGTGTFGTHFDSHCVFATQLIGAKRWTVYRPTYDLPISGQSSKEKAAPSTQDIVFDGILRAGDILYVPRGWWHEVKPIEGEPSLHIAIGVHTPKIVDYLKWMLVHKMSGHIEFRESLPVEGVGLAEVVKACELLKQESTDSASVQDYFDAHYLAIAEKPYVDFSKIF